ncbi:MAG TPA: hypothetical protein ENJ40_08025 [Thermosulfurimonas dismutans]|uniref:Uncharacterized protein n=1 Tax=Thermosulfurimonas dismutans TaxID=999894 RepID=A0A7C3GVR5_9BACT|nr:hypothetical protein [Thermosulfurimonas dismutans]
MRCLKFGWLLLVLLAPAVLYAGVYTSSIHGSPTYGVARDSIYNNYNVSRGNCLHCHEMHASVGGSEPAPTGGAPSPYGLFEFEEKVCFYCHGTNSHNVPPLSKDIEALFQKKYRHPVERSGLHKKPAFKETEADLRPPNRHSECVDCHNPHAVQRETHTMGSPPGNYTSPQDNNRVSGVLRGTFGVEPNWQAQDWTVPTTFTELRPDKNSPAGGAEREYQLCLKCHSYYGLGSAENTGTGVTTITGPSGVSLTDQALEFSPYNYSGHPVTVAADNRPGGYAPKALIDSSYGSRLKPPWDTHVGQQTMYCSDCHGEDAATEIKGPHGSDAKFMLVDGRTWPEAPSVCGGGLWTLSDIASSTCWQDHLLCAKCHVLYNNGFLNNVHRVGFHHGTPCVSCHMAVPHGSHASRLIVYRSDPAPYNYNGTTAKLDGFCKASSPDSYTVRNCYSPVSPCSRRHGWNNPGGCSSNQTSYDP